MDQSEFIENLQNGKQIGKLLDMPKGPQAQKHMFWVWTMDKLKKSIFWLCAQRSNVGVSFLFLFQNMLYVAFDGRVSFHVFPEN